MIPLGKTSLADVWFLLLWGSYYEAVWTDGIRESPDDFRLSVNNAIEGWKALTKMMTPGTHHCCLLIPA
jgi:hypothetical protein